MFSEAFELCSLGRTDRRTQPLITDNCLPLKHRHMLHSPHGHTDTPSHVLLSNTNALLVLSLNLSLYNVSVCICHCALCVQNRSSLGTYKRAASVHHNQNLSEQNVGFCFVGLFFWSLVVFCIWATLEMENKSGEKVIIFHLESSISVRINTFGEKM